nr:unnamed protein product [Callosobruchus chinensis]
MPYNYSCPTVELKLSSRNCKTRGLHRASFKSLNRHIKKIHKKVNTFLLAGSTDDKWFIVGGWKAYE